MQNTTLTLTTLLATYLSFQSLHSPNPPPQNPTTKDRLFRTSVLLGKIPKIGNLLFLALSLAHTLTIARGIGQATPPSTFCPNPQNLNPLYFRWSGYVKTCLALVITSGVLRLAAYRSLGKDFTFELAAPTRLKTDGIYKYVQHPSYLPLIVVATAHMALVGMPDGVVGCLLPEMVAERARRWKWEVLGTWAVGWVGVVGVRVRDEEEMLRRAFGGEWLAWSRATRRFVPWVF